MNLMGILLELIYWVTKERNLYNLNPNQKYFLLEIANIGISHGDFNSLWVFYYY